MAVYNYFYVKSNDGNTTLFTSAEKLYNSDNATVTETGITFTNGEIYTYSGNKKFIGIASSANSDLPDYAVGSTFPQALSFVYIVEEQPKPTEYTLRIDGVEVTDYENVIVNGVSYKCKKGASVPSDLTGYTISVPTGWILGDLGTYILYGILSYVSTGPVPIHNTFVFDMFRGKSTGIIFSNTGDPSQKTISSGAFDLEITGGLDTTNSILIQWFVDNGATFTKIPHSGGA